MKSRADILSQIETAEAEAIELLRNEYTDKDGKLIENEGSSSGSSSKTILNPKAYISALEGEFNTLKASVNNYFEATKTLNFKALYNLMHSVKMELSREYKNGKHLSDYLSYDESIKLYDFEDFTFSGSSVYNSIEYEIVKPKPSSSSGSGSNSSGGSSGQSQPASKNYKKSLLVALNSTLNTRHTEDLAKINAKIIRLSDKDEHYDLARSGELGFIVSQITPYEAHKRLYEEYFKEFKEKREITVPFLEGYLKSIDTTPEPVNNNINLLDIADTVIVDIKDDENTRTIKTLGYIEVDKNSAYGKTVDNSAHIIEIIRSEMNGFKSLVFRCKDDEDAFSTLKYDIRNKAISDYTDVDPAILAECEITADDLKALKNF